MSKIFVIALYTFKEILQSRIVLNVALLGLGLMGVSYVASEFTYGVPKRVALDFGVGTFSLSAVAIAIFMGATLLSKELESRTVYMALSRSITRFQFLVGKVLGLSLVLGLNILVLATMCYTVFLLLGGSFSPLMLWVILFAFLEAFILLNVVVVFSLVTNIALSVFYTIVIFVTGHAIPATLELGFVQKNVLLEGMIRLYSFFFPNLSILNYKDYLIYESSIPLGTLAFSCAYGLGYATLLVCLNGFIFLKRELN